MLPKSHPRAGSIVCGRAGQGKSNGNQMSEQSGAALTVKEKNANGLPHGKADHVEAVFAATTSILTSPWRTYPTTTVGFTRPCSARSTGSHRCTTRRSVGPKQLMRIGLRPPVDHTGLSLCGGVR